VRRTKTGHQNGVRSTEAGRHRRIINRRRFPPGMTRRRSVMITPGKSPVLR
jgi:hypothetical protein